jgi:hypothetical protein
LLTKQDCVGAVGQSIFILICNLCHALVHTFAQH